MNRLLISILAGTSLSGLSCAAALAYDKRHYLPPRAERHFIEYGYTSDRPYYYAPDYGHRRYYRSHRPYEFVTPVYVAPSYRFTYGYPWSYPSYGYVMRGFVFP